MNKDTKIEISVGCCEYLLNEVKNLREDKKYLSVKSEVMDNFFNLINNISPKNNIGYSEDLLWQAKKEIEAAIYKKETENK